MAMATVVNFTITVITAITMIVNRIGIVIETAMVDTVVSLYLNLAIYFIIIAFSFLSPF